MNRLLLFCFLFTINVSLAQEVEIPEKMTFANMELKLTDQVRKVLKSEVEAIRRNPKYFQIKVERANLYFPIIEKVFKQENFPDDFKYLALQESSLVSDAVSSSNAVGYWQFKKESAQEVGLRVDNEVDERINLVSSTLGATKYLRRNNATLDNWIYALLSYNLGLGGVKSHVESKYVGARQMTIDKNMHWYVIRFLAHKIAYENEVGKAAHSELRLIEYTKGSNKSLSDIASEVKVSGDDLEAYNKWLLKKKIPDDKVYTVIIPAKVGQDNLITLENDQEELISEREPADDKGKKGKKGKKDKSGRKNIFAEPVNDNPYLTSFNELKAIKAQDGDSFDDLASKAGIGVVDIAKFNELRKHDKPKAGMYYYLQPKRSKALVLSHTVKKGESLWDISQKYGIHTRAIRKKNRMGRNEPVEEGRVLWLRNKIPMNSPIQFENTEESKPAAKEEVKPAPVAKEAPKQPEKENIDNKAKENPKEKIVIINGGEQGSSAQTKIKYHTVEQGETLYSISKKYGASVEDLVVWNSMVNTSLKPGQKLIVAKGTQEEDDDATYHIAEPGDTIYKISRLYGVSVTEIMEWNGKQDYTISVGEKIKIKK
ncbi:MAG: LysM peptidoglycan-binding domain-containing protein [Cytophagaceae bacterium]